VPGIYVHSLFGSRNCHACVEETGRARSINREKFRRADLEAQLADPTSIQSRVLRGYLHLLRQRAAHPAFHPQAGQRVLSLHKALFALVRTAPASLTGGDEETVLCLVNVSSDQLAIQVDLSAWDLPQTSAWQDLIQGEVHATQQDRLALTLDPQASAWQDLIQGDAYATQQDRLALTLDAYQTLWLRPTL
jgi:sucrose phosphorylase